MKKFFTFMLVAVLTFCVASALAEGKLTVTSKNVIIKIGDDSGIFVAKVEMLEMSRSIMTTGS